MSLLHEGQVTAHVDREAPMLKQEGCVKMGVHTHPETTVREGRSTLLELPHGAQLQREKLSRQDKARDWPWRHPWGLLTPPAHPLSESSEQQTQGPRVVTTAPRPGREAESSHTCLLL